MPCGINKPPLSLATKTTSSPLFQVVKCLLNSSTTCKPSCNHSHPGLTHQIDLWLKTVKTFYLRSLYNFFAILSNMQLNTITLKEYSKSNPDMMKTEEG
jgi:hypothetical protein